MQLLILGLILDPNPAHQGSIWHTGRVQIGYTNFTIYLVNETGKWIPSPHLNEEEQQDSKS